MYTYIFKKGDWRSLWPITVTADGPVEPVRHHHRGLLPLQLGNAKADDRSESWCFYVTPSRHSATSFGKTEVKCCISDRNLQLPRKYNQAIPIQWRLTCLYLSIYIYDAILTHQLRKAALGYCLNFSWQKDHRPSPHTPPPQTLLPLPIKFH